MIGAGIGGLTTALALAQRGAQVTVHERADGLSELGAGVQISPNGGRVLTALGLTTAIDAVALRAESVILNDARNRQVVHLDLLKQRPQERFRFIHRARLVEVLAQAAHDAGVVFQFSSPVETAPAGDLIVAADGLHSVQRAALNGESTPFFTGQTAWRALIDDDPDPAPVAQVFMGPGRHLVSYPLAGGLRNIVAVLETRDWAAEGWSAPGDPEAMQAAFAGFGGPMVDWLNRVQRCGYWGLFRHPVAGRWTDGRIVLIGDAAHPTLPFLAQGACMAIEDAWRLTHHLHHTEDQAQALQAFEAERLPRTRSIVDMATANARNYHLTGAKRWAGHTVLRLGSRLAPAAAFNRFAWVYDYNPTA